MAPGPDDTILRSGDAHPAGEERPGDAIGPYKLVSIIGEGGFGTVWLAERREPFAQRVALKLIKAGMDSKSVLARFEQERQALAVMNHPNIAKVLDGGLTPRGRPYFAMELVKGEPITEFCDARKLSIRARLELFAQACDAVQHAHLKSIVHRDLKPSNILAFDVEGEAPRVKVIDFGVAKAMSQPLTEKSIFTETGQMIGTPEYMSPEQANPSLADIDTRSDVYSLGVLLYELVTGATPFDGKALRSKAYGEIQRILREEEPPTPSARLSTISTKDSELASRIERSRGVAVRQLTADLKSELEWIPLKAMRKEPQNRYQTALDLRRDVDSYIRGDALSIRPESVRERALRYVRRKSSRLLQVVSLLCFVWALLALPEVGALLDSEQRLYQSVRSDELSFEHGLLLGEMIGEIKAPFNDPSSNPDPETWPGMRLDGLRAWCEAVHERKISSSHELLVWTFDPERAGSLSHPSAPASEVPVDWQATWQQVVRDGRARVTPDSVRRVLTAWAYQSDDRSHPIFSTRDPEGSWLWLAHPPEDAFEFPQLDHGPVLQANGAADSFGANSVDTRRLDSFESERRRSLGAHLPAGSALLVSPFWGTLLIPPIFLMVAILYVGPASSWRWRWILMLVMFALAFGSGLSSPVALSAWLIASEATGFVIACAAVAIVAVLVGWLRGWRSTFLLAVAFTLGAGCFIVASMASPYRLMMILWLLDGTNNSQ